MSSLALALNELVTTRKYRKWWQSHYVTTVQIDRLPALVAQCILLQLEESFIRKQGWLRFHINRFPSLSSLEGGFSRLNL